MVTPLVQKAFRNYPRLSNCVCYGSLYVGAEFSQQIIRAKFPVVREGAFVIKIRMIEENYTKTDSWGNPPDKPNQPFEPSEFNKEKLDLGALGRYFVVGSIINSNYLYTWYKWLDNKYKGTHRKIIVKKVLLDQFVMTPPLYVIFFVSMSIMEGSKDILKECREKFFKTFTVSCFFWLPTQTANFLFVPNAARVVYIGVCSFAWANILCWIKRE